MDGGNLVTPTARRTTTFRVVSVLLITAVAAVTAALWTSQRLKVTTAIARVRSRAVARVPDQPRPRPPAEPAAETSVSLLIHPATAVPRTDRATIEEIYLGKKKTWSDGQPIVPVLLRETSEPSREFLMLFLGKSPEQYRAYWLKELFAGATSVPRTFDSPEKLLDFVASTPGAIGFVEGIPDNPRVRVLPVTDLPTRNPLTEDPGPESPGETGTPGATSNEPVSLSLRTARAPLERS